MNANLRKEIRLVLPIVATSAAVWWLSALTSKIDPGHPLGAAVFVLACLLVGIRPFCAEFQHRTMGLLCAQPIRRSELWRTKRSVQLFSFAALSVVWQSSAWMTALFDLLWPLTVTVTAYEPAPCSAHPYDFCTNGVMQSPSRPPSQRRARSSRWLQVTIRAQD